MKNTVDDNDLLHEDELEPEGLEEDVTEADLEQRSELEEETAEFEAEEAEGEQEVVLTPLEPEEDVEGDEAEATLDEILRRRFEGEEEYEEEEEEEESEARAVASSAEELRPRSAVEFVCQSCFLVKHRTQLADADRSLCRDCANNART